MTFKNLHTARQNPLAVRYLGLTETHVCTADLAIFPNLSLLHLTDCTLELTQGVQLPTVEDLLIVYRKKQTLAQVGFLPLVFPDLLSLHLEYVENAEEIKQSIGTMSRLQKLIINQCDLEVLPFERKIPPTLTHIDVCGNRIAALPKVLGKAKNLDVLRADFNDIARIDFSFAKLTKLRILSLKNNKINRLPQLDRAENLAEIDLSQNSMTYLPKALLRCRFLYKIDISDNDLQTLPRQISDMPRLRTLYANGCGFAGLPHRFVELRRLVNLSLQRNKFRRFPKLLCELPKLERLDLTNNQLLLIPSQIEKLTALRSLYVAGNELTDLPAALGRLPKLFDLALERNRFDTLPQAVLFAKSSRISGLPRSRFLHTFREAFAAAEVQSETEILAAFALLNEDKSPKISVPGLLLLTKVKLPLLREKVQDLLAKKLRRTAPLFDFAAKIKYAVAGSPSLDYDFLLTENNAERLDNYAAADVIVLGENIEKKALEKLLRYGDKVITEREWTTFLKKQNTSYLLQPDNADARENVGEMLRSPEPSNRFIAAGIMLTGGLPAAFKFEMIFLPIDYADDPVSAAVPQQVCRLYLNAREFRAAAYFWGFFLEAYSVPFKPSMARLKVLCAEANLAYENFYAYYTGWKKQRKIPV